MASRAPLVWIAPIAYSLLAVALFSSTWIDPAGSWIGSPKDPGLFIWYLGWIPHELAQGHNPLFTDYLSYPPGVNLMWNTSMIFPALLLWPVTAHRVGRFLARERYWQSVASYRFRMPEGDAFTPGPYLGPHPSFL